MDEVYEGIAEFYGMRLAAAAAVYRLAVLRGASSKKSGKHLMVTEALNLVVQDQRECMCLAYGEEFWAVQQMWN